MKDCLFDDIRWSDPTGRGPLEPIIVSRTPAGVPIQGALRIKGTNEGYPIVDSVARLTPQLAHLHHRWLAQLELNPPEDVEPNTLQSQESVESFGFQWELSGTFRSEVDLQWRIADRFSLTQEDYRGVTALDAGCGAGDQSRWLLANGARVLSVDLSPAIDVTARKLRLNPDWFGVQCDLLSLPLGSNQFTFVYCEGVIQHTNNSAKAVHELLRVLCPHGHIAATHYIVPQGMRNKLQHGLRETIRRFIKKYTHYQVLFFSGFIAALNYVPIIGWFMRKLGIALYSELMPRFSTTWINTYDYFGPHSYQRFITTGEFLDYFESTGLVDVLLHTGPVILAKKREHPPYSSYRTSTS